MDKKNFAEPGFMLAAADTVVLIGVIVYFQSQIVRLKEQIAGLRCHCSSPSPEERVEEKFLLRQLSSRLEALETRLNTLPSASSEGRVEREEGEEEEEDPVMRIVLDIANRPTAE